MHVHLQLWCSFNTILKINLIRSTYEIPSNSDHFTAKILVPAQCPGISPQHRSRVTNFTSELYIPNPCSDSGLISLQKAPSAFSVCWGSAIQADDLEAVPLLESETVCLYKYFCPPCLYIFYICHLYVFCSHYFWDLLNKVTCHIQFPLQYAHFYCVQNVLMPLSLVNYKSQHINILLCSNWRTEPTQKG